MSDKPDPVQKTKYDEIYSLLHANVQLKLHLMECKSVKREGTVSRSSLADKLIYFHFNIFLQKRINQRIYCGVQNQE